ncbi:hypothetical protein LDENG_00189840 [Lucifuga dentata]|nr:hypothetical protein LDENG_00189840 [Lucifuga dentata]
MSLRGEVCVVTGAFGFLGQRLVRLLLDEEYLAEVRLLDIHIPPKLLENLQNVRMDVKLTPFQGDIRNSDLVREVCRGASIVFHTASLIDVMGAVDYSELYSVNVKGTQVLLEACIQENVMSFIYTSSIEVAGPNPQGDPIVNGNEDTVYPCTLKFDYSKTKKEAEEITLRAHGEVLQDGQRLATCALRPMYIFGEGCRFLLGHMDYGIQHKNVLARLSLPDARVNPVYVGNVALAHLQAARGLRDPQKRSVIGGNFYYISDDTPPVSYSDFNHTVMAPLGFTIPTELSMPLFLLYLFCFLLEIVCFILHPFKRFVPPINRQLLTMVNTAFSFSYQKAKKDLGYIPRYTWQEARSRTTGWLASQLPKEKKRLLSQ